MAVTVLEYYRRKAEFLSPEFQDMAIYVRRGELAQYVNPDEWDFVAPALHPNMKLFTEVEENGYCIRTVAVGVRLKALYNNVAST